MKKQLFSALAITGILFGTSGAASAQGHQGQQAYQHRYKHVQLLGINDFHGQLNVTRTVNGKEVGGAAYLAAYLEKYEKKNKNTLLVNAGDSVGASPPVSALLQDEPTINFLNKIGMDVGTVGNHEFDEGITELKRLVNGGYHPATGDFAGADFPYTVANVVNKSTGEPILPPYVIKKVNGMPIAFIGVVTTETPSIVMPSGVKDVKFIDEATAINKYAKELKAKGVKSIVVLAHVPGNSDYDGSNARGEAIDMAKNIDDEVDVIFAGHNHGYINTTVDNKLIVESYSYGTAFSDVDLAIDPKTKDIVEKQADIITTYHDGIEPDPEIEQMVKQDEKEVGPIINEVVGQAGENITQDTSPAGESALGDLVADSQVRAMKSDISLMNPGGIRVNLNQGEITWGDLYTMLPFGNTLIQMDLTGAQLKDVLNQQWQGDRAKILQISGFHYTWDASAPNGDKIKSMTLADGTPIKMDQTYTVTVNNFLADGGDGFTALEAGQNIVQGPSALDAMVDYIKTFDGPVTQDISGRIDRVE